MCLLSRVSNHFNLILFSLNLKFSTAYLSSNFLLETLFDQFSLFKIFTLCGFLREALTLCPKPFPLIMGWKKFWRSISNLWKKVFKRHFFDVLTNLMTNIHKCCVKLRIHKQFHPIVPLFHKFYCFWLLYSTTYN